MLMLPLSMWGQTPELVVPSGLKEIGGIYDVNITPDQQKLVAIAGKSIQIYSYTSGILFKTIVAKENMSRVCFSPDSKQAYVSGDKDFLVIDLEKVQISQTISTALGGLGMAQTADFKTVFFGYTGLQRFDIAKNSAKKVLEFPQEWGTLNKISVSPDGKQVLLMLFEYQSGIERSVIVDAQTGATVQNLPIGKDVVYPCFTPTGNVLKMQKKGELDSPDFEFSWLNPKTLKQIGEKRTVSNAYILGNRFDFVGNTDAFWGSFVNREKMQFLSPSQPFKELLLENTVAKGKYGWEAKTLKLTPNGQKMVVGTADNQVVELDLTTASQTRSFGASVFSPNVVVGNPNFKGLAMLDNAGMLVCLAAEKGQIRQRILGKNKVAPVFSNNGKLLAASNGDGVDIWQTNSFKSPLFVAHALNLDLMKYARGEAASFTRDDKLAALNGDVNVKIINATDGSLVQTLPTAATQSFFSTDGTTLYTYYKYPYGDKEVNYLQAWDIATQKKLWETNFKPAIFTALLRVEDGKCLIYDVFSGVVFDVNLKTGGLKKAQENQTTLAAAAVLSPSGKYITDRGRVYKSSPIQYVAARPKVELNYVQTGHFYGNDRLLISPLDINVIQISDWQNTRELGRLILSEDEDSWAFVTPDGRFDASDDMMKKLYYTKGTEIIPLDRLSEKYFTPKLFYTLLESFDMPKTEQDDINKLKAAPSVKIGVPSNQRNLIVEDDSPAARRYNMSADKISLKVEADCPDDGVSEIRLYHNGKLVGSGTRNLIVEDEKVEKIKTQLFDIQLVDGENSIKAVALNTQRTESRPDEIIVTYKAQKAQNTANTEGGITLHLLVIGINKYKNPKYNLNYALADATSFTKAVEGVGASIFNETNVVFLSDDKATKQGITAELDKIKTAANPKDVFIFYYAGHGVLNEKKAFYLVPHDVTQLYGNDDALAQKGLSANQLQQFSKDIKAQKQLFILDACQSAGALEQVVATRGAAEEKAIAQLARATGTHWLTASGSEQFASEFQQLGHGTFTYVLLEALSGKADKGGDKKITVKELDAYLQEVVPELTAKYKGTPQYPASYGFGNDFPIGVVKN